MGGGGNNNILSRAHISYYRAEDFYVCCVETNKQTKSIRDPSTMIPVRSRDYLSISCPNRDYVSVKSETNRAGINRADSIEIVQSD
jgi:hypothetical protein